MMNQCKCKDPKPYSPKGLCAPTMPLGACVKCGYSCVENSEVIKAMKGVKEMKLDGDKLLKRLIGDLNVAQFRIEEAKSQAELDHLFHKIERYIEVIKMISRGDYTIEDE